MYDVIVIGGGPTGSRVAEKLAGMGYGVVVVERKEKLGEPVCCTGIISQECVNSFTIDDNAIVGQMKSVRLFSPSGKRLRLLWREEIQARIVDRAVFDAAMANRAKDKGAEYVLNALVTDIEVGDNRVKVEAARQGERLSLEARVAVIANGFGSRLAVRLGLGKVDYFIVGTQVEVEPIGADEAKVYFGQEIAPGFFAWLVPIPPP